MVETGRQHRRCPLFSCGAYNRTVGVEGDWLLQAAAGIRRERHLSVTNTQQQQTTFFFSSSRLELYTYNINEPPGATGEVSMLPANETGRMNIRRCW